MTAKLAKIVLSIVVGMLGLVLVMTMLACSGPVAALKDIEQKGSNVLAAGTPNDVIVDASPTEIRADGDSNSTIVGTVRDQPGCNPVPGAFIAFTTSLGTIDQICYAEGEDASVIKSSGWYTEGYSGASGGQYVRACGTASPHATLSWTFMATAISMLYVKHPEGGVAEVQVDGSTAITVGMYAGTKIAAERVITAGLGSGSHIITVKYLTGTAVYGGSCILVDAFRCGATTDSNGKGTATLTSALLSCGSADAIVTALTGDPSLPYMITGTKSVKFTASVPNNVTVTADPNPIAADGTSTSVLEAAVKDQFGEYMPDCTMVGFATDENGSDPGVWAILPYELVEGEDAEVTKSSSWSTGTNSFHGGEVISSTTAGATASWYFTGTAVSLMYAKLSDAGVATVTVDSGLPITIDMYAASPKFQVEHVIAHCLSYGPHVITVTVGGYTVTGGTDTRVYVDAFRSGTSTSDGIATAMLTAGTKAGVVMVEATGVGQQCCEMDRVVTDTVPITLTAGNPYTLTITPTDIDTTCCFTSTLQFTVTDVYSNVVGAVVSRPLTVSFTSTPYGIFTPTNPVVVTDGVGSVEFHAWTEGIGTITGTVEGHGVVDTSNLTVAVASCYSLTISPDHREWLYVTDTNIYLLPGFPYTTAITANLRDSCDNPVQNGTEVTFTTSLGNLSPANPVTTVNGVATAVITSEWWWTGAPTPATPPTQTAYITVTGAGCPVSDTTTIDFVRHVYTLTVGAVPDTIPVGANLSTLTAVVTDGLGSHVLDGVRVSFTTIPSPTAMVSVPPGYVETVDGTATSTATSGIQAGVATIEAVATGTTVTNTRLITITAGVPYTLAITPADVDTECCNTQTLQFTVTDEYSNVVGAVVPMTLTVDFTSTPSGIFTPTNFVVITDGVGSVDFHGWTEGIGSITGTVQVYSVTGTSNLTVAAASCQTLTVSADQTRLYITDTHTSLLTDFPYSTTITANLKDKCDNPVRDGTAVTFTTSLGSLSPANPITTVNGLATAVLTSGNMSAGVPTQTAYITVTGAGCPVSGTTSVDFGWHVYTLTVTADPDEIRVGGFPSDLTADVKDGFGNPTPDGVRVVFTTTPTARAWVLPGYVETESGKAITAATSLTQTGMVTITAVAGGTVTNTGYLTITAGDPYTLTLTPTDVSITCCTYSTLQFTVTDRYSNVLGAASPRSVKVCLYCDPDTLVDSWSPGSCVVITNGVGSVEFHGYQAGTGIIRGYIQGFSDVQATSNITVTAGSPATLNVTREPDSILADGFDTAIITATVKDSCDNPVCNEIVTFTADSGSFDPPPDITLSVTRTTNCSGVATATLRSVCVSRRANITVTVDSLTQTTYVDMVGVAWDIQLTADPTSIQVGGHTSDLTAVVNDQFGYPVLDGTVVTFTTNLGSVGSDTTIKTTTGGVAEAILTSSETAGTATITATAGSGIDMTTDTVTVTFEAGPPYSVTVEAYPITLTVGGTSTLTATVTDQYNNIVVDGTVVTFTTSLGDVGSQLVTKTTTGGVATAELTSQEAGTALVTAMADSKFGTTNVTFQPDLPSTLTLAAHPTALTVGETSTLTATVKDQYDNNVADGTSVLFETNLGSLGSLTVTRTTANGIALAALTSQVPGTATIVATADSVSDTVDVTFEVGLPYTVTLGADPTSIMVGGFTSTLTVTVTDQFNNNVADGTSVLFETSLGSLGSVTVTKLTADGVAIATLTSGNTAGAAEVTAMADSKFDTTVVTFTPDVPYTVTLGADPTSLTVGETSTLTATVKDQYDNNVADGTSVLFETNLGSLGSLTVTKTTTDGIALAALTSQKPGTATVAATADSVSDTVDVAFDPGPPYTVTLVADPTSIMVGGFTSTLTVTVTDQFNNNVADGTVVHFETSLGSLGSVTVTKLTASGVATATLTSGNIAGLAMIEATAGSAVATTVVTFTPDVPDVITLVADPTSLTVGETSALTATVKDQYDNNVADGTSVHFETSLGSLGSLTVTKTTVDGIAVAALTSELPGAAMITATVDSKVATTTVEFQPGPPDTVTLVADPTSLTVGETSMLTATVKDQYNNNVADGTAVHCETSLGSLGSTTIDKTTVNGVVTATLTSQVSGVAVVTATSDSKYDTVNVTFNPGPPDTMTVEADPTSIPIGGFTSDIAATVRDQYNNLVADGTEVILVTDLGSIGSNSVVKTTVNGVANATLTSELIIGTATITATSGSVVGQTQVVFTVGAPETVTAESWPPTIEVGGNTATITATVRDIGGYPVADGTPVVFSTDFASLGSSTVTKYTTNGIAVATLTSGLTPGVAHVTATADSKFDTVMVKVAAGPPYAIEVTADPPYIPIGGAVSHITAMVKDRYDNNVTNGTNVDFITTLGDVSPSSDTTEEGMAVTILTSELNKGTARVTAISGPAQGWVDVIFTVGPPFYINVVADPTSIGLDGQTSDIRAQVKDIGGNNVADGTEVTFVTSLGVLGSDTIIKTTTNGVAEAVLTSETTAGTAVITATADSKYHTTQVVFNPDPPHTVTVMADPMAIPANGISTSAIRATVTDQYGNMVADGISCYFDTTLGSIWPPSDTTLNGVAETTLTSSEEPGTAIVKAICAGKQGTVYVSFLRYAFKLYLPVVLKGY